MLKLLTSLLLACASTSCVSAPKNIALTEPPASVAALNQDGKAEVYVVRTGIAGFAVTFGIHVNGEDIGGIRANDFVCKRVEPGTVHVRASTEADCEATFPVLAGQAYYLRASPKMGWWVARVQLSVMDPNEGRTAVEKCDDQTRDSARSQ
jgi:hypothetical protein